MDEEHHRLSQNKNQWGVCDGKKNYIFCLGSFLFFFSASAYCADTIKIGMVVTSTGAQGYLGASAMKGAGGCDLQG